MSAVGICDRCDIGHGGVYFILTHVLGGKVGGTVGLMYCVGHVSKYLICSNFAGMDLEFALVHFRASRIMYDVLHFFFTFTKDFFSK